MSAPHQPMVALALAAGTACLGIELGSTRIKACLIDPADSGVIAAGSHEWASTFDGEHWTYRLSEVTDGLRAAYADLAADCERRHGSRPTHIAALGVSAMMHGYLAFDAEGGLLTPFRTWRNTTTEVAAERLSAEFGVNIPQRWSVAHLYQAALNGEEHVSRVRRLTTLAGYVHRELTGESVLGVGDASGMFPLDATGIEYDGAAMTKLDALMAARGFTGSCRELFPQIRRAGDDAGRLTPAGAALLDPTGSLRPGALACPPEGDAGTGMVATGALRPRTGTVSVGTSTFAMVVLERPLATARAEIDVVATPVGDPVAMVHCNNGAGELALWVELFRSWAAAAGASIDPDAAYAALLGSADEAASRAGYGAEDAGRVMLHNLAAGEPVVDTPGGAAILVRPAGSSLDLANFARAQLFGVYAALAVGMRTLAGDGVGWDRMVAHGGLFRTPGAAQRLLAAALRAPVTVARTASEGGAWGMAILAAYRWAGADRPLQEFVRSASRDVDAVTVQPGEADMAGFAAYLDRFTEDLEWLRKTSYAV